MGTPPKINFLFIFILVVLIVKKKMTEDIYFVSFYRYFPWFHAQEACYWGQEEGLEEEEKVSSFF